jgi:Sds3-like
MSEQPDVAMPEKVERRTIDLEEERRKSALGNMERIEKEFTDLKSSFFEQKVQALDSELKQLEEGTHDGYLAHLEELKRARQHKEWQAREWLELQQQNIAVMYNSEMKQAEDEYLGDAAQLKQQLREQLGDQRRRIMDDRAAMTLQGEDTERVVPRTRLLRKRSASSATNAAGPHGLEGGVAQSEPVFADTMSSHEAANAKRQRTAPPHIQYMLADGQIAEDLAVIQSAAAQAYTGTNGRDEEIDAASLSGLVGERVMYLDSALHVGDNVFPKDSDVSVVAVADGSSFQGKLTSISAADATITSSDNTNHRVTLASLRSGAHKIVLI